MINKRMRGLAAAAAAGVALTTFASAVPASAKTNDDNGPVPNAAGGTTSRVWGLQAWNTSVHLSKTLQQNGTMSSCGEVFIVGGSEYNFSDTLALAPLADNTNNHVLSLDYKNNLPADGAVQNRLKELKSSGVTKVTLIGGVNAVPVPVEQAIKAMGFQVSRIAGTSYDETAYYLAAEAVAGYQGTQCGIPTRWALSEAQAAEDAYQLAAKNYEAARADYAVKLATVQALEAQVAALQAQIADLATKLQNTSGPTAAEIAAAQADVTDANAVLVQANSDWGFLTKFLGTDPKTTLDIKSTLGEYRAILSAADKATLTAVEARIGASDATTLEDAIVLAQIQRQNAAAEVASTSLVLADLVKQAADAAAANQANRPILDQMAKVQAQLDAAMAKLVAANVALADSYKKLVAAEDKLIDATQARPNPGDLESLKATYRKNADEVVTFAGNSTVFLARGDFYSDALAGGPAAAQTNGVMLLTAPGQIPTWTKRYLDKSGAQVVTVGGPAATAVGTDATIKLAKSFTGKTLYDTAAEVTNYYFAEVDKNTSAPLVVANGDLPFDAVLASPFAANIDGGVLFTHKSEIPASTSNYVANIADDLTPMYAIGGQAVIDQAVVDQFAKWTGTVTPVQ